MTSVCLLIIFTCECVYECMNVCMRVLVQSVRDIGPGIQLLQLGGRVGAADHPAPTGMLRQPNLKKSFHTSRCLYA